MLEAHGALRYRQEADHELRKLGRPLHRRTRPGKADGTGVDTLTERELELARLVVDRRTNPEIAAALFLSQKTVETHLRNMFRKLGVSSRVELARAVEQADRDSAGVGRNLLRPHELAGRARLAVLVADDQQRALRSWAAGSDAFRRMARGGRRPGRG